VVSCEKDEEILSEGDQFLYAGTEIEILKIKEM
jgi:hypothetical protein